MLLHGRVTHYVRGKQMRLAPDGGRRFSFLDAGLCFFVDRIIIAVEWGCLCMGRRFLTLSTR